MVQFDTLILRPGLLGLEGWQAVLRLLQKVKPAVLLKKTGDVVETLALLLSVWFRPELQDLGLVLL